MSIFKGYDDIYSAISLLICRANITKVVADRNIDGNVYSPFDKSSDVRQSKDCSVKGDV